MFCIVSSLNKNQDLTTSFFLEEIIFDLEHYFPDKEETLQNKHEYKTINMQRIDFSFNVEVRKQFSRDFSCSKNIIMLNVDFY